MENRDLGSILPARTLGFLSFLMLFRSSQKMPSMGYWTKTYFHNISILM